MFLLEKICFTDLSICNYLYIYFYIINHSSFGICNYNIKNILIIFYHLRYKTFFSRI